MSLSNLDNGKNLIRSLVNKILVYNKQDISTGAHICDSFNEILSSCHSYKLSFDCVEERIYMYLRESGRDLDSVKLRRLLNLFRSLAAVWHKAELLEFFYQLSRHRLEKDVPDLLNISDCFPKKTNVDGTSANERSSSGFYSDFASLPSEHSKPSLSRIFQSKLVGKPGESTSSSQLEANDLVNLWGPQNSSTSRSVHLHSSLNRLVTQQLSKTSLPPKAANQVTVSETDILRELLFVLNGVGGNLIKYNHGCDAFRLVPNICVPVGQQDIVHRIAECGWLHDQLRQFVTRVRKDRSTGAVIQSLASGIHEHLTEYYRLVATLETQLNQDRQEVLDTINDRSVGNPPNVQLSDLESKPAKSRYVEDTNNNSGYQSVGFFSSGSQPTLSRIQPLTLTRLMLWVQEPRFRLRFLANLCDVCTNLKGGALASVVYAYTLHGDPEVRFMMHNLLVNIASTLLHFICQWIYDGQLEDPYQEFFVAANLSVKKERLWHDKYNLRPQMIPRFITSSQASKILLTGKSINFLIYACGEKQGIKDRESIKNTRLKRVESMFDQAFDSSFDQMISTAYEQTSHHLLDTLIGRYHFLDHLKATRQFLLLGQGDFIQHLMDLLDTELSKSASQLLTHRLSSTLETAIRDTNAQYEQPEILQRLDVRLLEMSADDTGWDVFSLDYHVDGPLGTIFTDDCRLMYLRAFNFLWRAKRMEFTLSNLWKQQLICARLGYDLQSDLALVLHLTQLFSAEIRHFVQQLQYYINFEVLECAWEALVKHVISATDLVDVINAHHSFLSSVITRCLLDAGSRQLLGQLRTVFNLILSFAQLHQDFSSTALTELGVRERYARKFKSTDPMQDQQEIIRRQHFVENSLVPLQAQIRIQASAYRVNVIRFITMLNNHPDQSLRFLADHLNFNGYYYQQQPMSSYGASSTNKSGVFYSGGSTMSLEQFPKRGGSSSSNEFDAHIKPSGDLPPRINIDDKNYRR